MPHEGWPGSNRAGGAAEAVFRAHLGYSLAPGS
jgi:hypothetical protein